MRKLSRPKLTLREPAGCTDTALDTPISAGSQCMAALDTPLCSGSQCIAALDTPISANCTDTALDTPIFAGSCTVSVQETAGSCLNGNMNNNTVRFYTKKNHPFYRAQSGFYCIQYNRIG